MGKPIVWFVDDLSSNLHRFENNHGRDFKTRTFEKPSQVLDALDKEHLPDALLCDIYFYDSVSKAESIEERINHEAKNIREIAKSIGADSEETQKGITLIENVVRHFNGKPPFPIYAYTSKGPYILGVPGFDRVVRSGAKWLFKGRYDPDTERWIINRDIREIKSQKWQKLVWKYLWVIISATGIISWFIGKFLEGILTK